MNKEIGYYPLSFKSYPLNWTLIHEVCVKAGQPDHPDQQKCKQKKKEWAIACWTDFRSQKIFAIASAILLIYGKYMCVPYLRTLQCYTVVSKTAARKRMLGHCWEIPYCLEISCPGWQLHQIKAWVRLDQCSTHTMSGLVSQALDSWS